MKVMYEQQFINALLNYLATLPYAQVAQFIMALQQGEPVSGEVKSD